MVDSSEVTKHLEKYYRTIEGYHDLIEHHPRDSYVVPPELLLPYVRKAGLTLDIAGGSGINAHILSLDPGRYVCIDFSLQGLTIASDKNRGMCAQANVGELPVKDESVDSVLCSWSLEHMAEPGIVLDEMIRIVKRGGHVLIWGPNWDNIFRKDFPQFAHKTRQYVRKQRWMIFFKMLRNELLLFRYKPYINVDVAALADSGKYISGDTDAVHCVLCQETYKMFKQKGMEVKYISDFSHMGKHLRNDLMIRMVRRILTIFLPILRHIPLLRWFVIRFPIVVEKPVSRR